MMFEHSNEHNVQDLSDCDQMSIEVENDALGPNEVPMDTTEVPKDDFSKLYMELIERVVEIQSMWDENRLPVGVQDRMLRLLFGDFGEQGLVAPLDGFQTSRTTQKSCGVVEVLLLNAGPIDVLPVLFIPQSCKKSVKNSGDVFSTCLTPLVDELEKLLLHGEDVAYEYPVEKIFDSPEAHAKLCKIRAMVMMVTGDHPVQCKIGMFKNGGSNFSRRDKAQATLKPDGRYVYDENRYQARFPPSHRSFGEMKAALEDAKRCCTLAEKEEAWKKSALKVLSAWRANYAGNKRVLGNPTSNIAYGDPPSVSKYDPKVYEQVFRPPPPMHRDAEKLYGRKFLLRHHPDQYRVLLSNYGEVGKWFAKVDSIGDLRNNLERKNHVWSIIRDKIGNLKDIVIDGAFYPWKEDDIYSWCIKSLASKRKYSKKKIDQSMSSSSGSMPINQDLDDEGVGDLHEIVTDLHQDAPLDKTIENAQDDNDLVKLDDMGAIMVHEKEKEEEKSAHEDVEVYIPEIP
ncbi:hypothetical protein L7F22_053280 [Adiantum nelumboides]|nr:hypothetical protein [Adiantum nelumboides]